MMKVNSITRRYYNDHPYLVYVQRGSLVRIYNDFSAASWRRLEQACVRAAAQGITVLTYTDGYWTSQHEAPRTC